MHDEDSAYFERRAALAVELAQRANCRAAVRAHYEMSKAYLDRAYGSKASDNDDPQIAA